MLVAMVLLETLFHIARLSACKGDWQKAVGELAPAVDCFERFVGSRDQRDLLVFTYINALLRTGDKKKAKDVLFKSRPKFFKTAPIQNLN